MTQLIDRRLNGKNRSAVNRQKFIQRYKSQIKKAVAKAISKRNMTDMQAGEKITIPSKDIVEPTFGHGNGGVRETVHPGNQDFVQGDEIERPRGGGQGTGRGNGAGRDGGGEDDFVFELSREEFMQFFFEDMELPNLVKTQLANIVDEHKVRAGYTTDGVPTNINVIRSLRNALGRRVALSSPYRKQLRAAEEELAGLLKTCEESDERVIALQEKIEGLKRKIDNVPFIDPFDLRYNNLVKRTKPATQAVMFCLMDVSGSMDQEKKDLAKRFFMLLYLFLTRTYDRIQLVFIRHHATAEEVDEDRFFNQRETGGTLVSSALEMMAKIIKERFPPHEWNIYGAQASDGDNLSDDSPVSRDILLNDIMPYVQYYAYVEISIHAPQNLWREYLNVQSACPHFAMRRIESAADIYPVLRDLFKKQA